MNYPELNVIGAKAKEASRILACLQTSQKNSLLSDIATAIIARSEEILNANAADVRKATAANLAATLVDRLLLTHERIMSAAQGLQQIITLNDPVGETAAGWTAQSGITIRKQRVPLGVICIIYEARPNVTLDAAALCFKSGNSVILRGGKEAFETNSVLTAIMQDCLKHAGLPAECIQLVPFTDRPAVFELLRLNKYIDVVIPRGGAGLIKMVVENSSIPVIETGSGICHTFVDASADINKALAICVNAKTSRPGVCNAMETLLVHNSIAAAFMPRLVTEMLSRKVELRGCEKSLTYSGIVPATCLDWETEYLDLILSVKIVNSIDEAIEHISRYTTGHSEAIITNDFANARRFQQEVDAAAVYVNASTRFTDGYEFGFGAEIGISTQKLHARGPMGLTELTSVKYLVEGNGHIR